MQYEAAHLILKTFAAAHVGRGGFADQLWHTLSIFAKAVLDSSFFFPSGFKYLALIFPAGERILNTCYCLYRPNELP